MKDLSDPIVYTSLGLRHSHFIALRHLAASRDTTVASLLRRAVKQILEDNQDAGFQNEQ